MDKPKEEHIKLARKLMTNPPKESNTNMPMIDPSIENNATHQIDLLYLPHDNGYKYLLVCVDLGSRLCDAEPMKTKTALSTKEALEKIYKRKILGKPILIQADDGKEFKGAFRIYLQQNKIMFRQGKPNRHRQQAVVERYNATIARSIFLILHAKELETGQTAREWVKYIREIINLINTKVQKRKAKKYDLKLRCEGRSCKLLEIGTKVYIISDQPRDSTGVKLMGKHRITDLRYEPQEHTITDIVLRPSQPPMYKVSGIKNVNYTREQLLLVD